MIGPDKVKVQLSRTNRSDKQEVPLVAQSVEACYWREHAKAVKHHVDRAHRCEHRQDRRVRTRLHIGAAQPHERAVAAVHHHRQRALNDLLVVLSVTFAPDVFVVLTGPSTQCNQNTAIIHSSLQQPDKVDQR